MKEPTTALGAFFNSLAQPVIALANQFHPVNIEGTAVRGRLGSFNWQMTLATIGAVAITGGMAAGVAEGLGLLQNSWAGIQTIASLQVPAFA